MVSGFLTSPYDQDRIMSGDASPILIRSKSSTALCCLNSLSRSFIPCHLSLSVRANQFRFDTNDVAAGLRHVEVDVDAERANLLDQHVERLRHAGLHLVRAV